MIANGWKVCSIFLHEVRSGDVILVAKVGMETLSHAALFMSPQNIFHVNLTDRTGVVCSVRDFQESYDIYLTRDQIFNPTPSPTAKKLKTVTSVVRSNTCPDLAGSLPTPSLPLLKRGATDFAPRIPSPEPKSPTVDDKVPTQKV